MSEHKRRRRSLSRQAATNAVLLAIDETRSPKCGCGKLRWEGAKRAFASRERNCVDTGHSPNCFAVTNSSGRLAVAARANRYRHC